MDAVLSIEKYAKGFSYKKFLKNRLVQDGVIRQIEIIREATKRLSLEMREKSQDIQWRNIAGMRDKLIHDYMGVDIDAVWDTVKKDILDLKAKLKNFI
jgi:uncharacterized protein with HEPN domain